MNKPCARITLDLQQASTPTFVAVKKSDIGREIRITLSDGGFPYDIAADCYAVLTGTKPDGNILYNHCDIVGNTIVYEITEQTTAAAGRMKAEVKLYGADDQLVTSATFRIIIDGTVYDEGKVESKDEVSALTHLVSEAAGVINNGNQMIEQVTALAEDVNQLKADLGDKVPKTDYAPETKTESMTQPVGKDENGKLWTAPGSDCAVSSVNGKTGAIVLTAEDVKARPDSWMPTASDVGAIPNTTKIPAKTSDLTNDSGFITGYTETDPTVPSWAKQSTKPSYSKSEVGLGNVDNVKQYSASNPPPYPVTSVNGKTGAVTITVPTVPTNVSSFTNDAGYLTEHQDISGKVDKVEGKGLSSNDYDNTAKAKVDAIPENPKYTDTVYDDTEVKQGLNQLKDDLGEEIHRAITREREIETLFSAPTQEAVNIWLDNHPEATTTVADGSITEGKLSETFFTNIDFIQSEEFNVTAGETIYNTQKLIMVSIPAGNEYAVEIIDINESLSAFHLYEGNTEGVKDIGSKIPNVRYTITASKDIEYISIWTVTAPKSDATIKIKVTIDSEKISIVDTVHDNANIFNNADIEHLAAPNNDYGVLISYALSKYKSVTLNGEKEYTVKTPIIIGPGRTLYGNGATIINEAGTYFCEIVNSVGNISALRDIKVVKGTVDECKGVIIKGPNITVSGCCFIDVNECIYVPKSFNSYEFMASDCHLHGNTLIDTGINVQATDSYFENITMLNYKYPMLIGGGNTKVKNLHPWIGVGIENDESVCITMCPETGGTASLYISDTCFDGYSTIFKYQNDYSSIFCINSNSVYSPYKWNDTTKIPKLVDNTTDKYCRLSIIGSSFINSAGSKTIDDATHNMLIYTSNSRVNCEEGYSQHYTVTKINKNLDVSASSVTRRDGGFDIKIMVNCLNNVLTTPVFRVCGVSLLTIPTALKAVIKRSSDNSVSVIDAYIDNYSVYIISDELTIDKDDILTITGFTYAK